MENQKKRFIKLLFQFNQINLIDFHSLKLFFYGTVTFWSFRVWSTTTTTQTSSQPINTDILIFFLYKDNDCPKKGIMFELYNVFIVPEFNLWNFLFYSFLPFFDCSNFFLTYTPCAWTWFFSNHNNRWPWFSLLFFLSVVLSDDKLVFFGHYHHHYWWPHMVMIISKIYIFHLNNNNIFSLYIISFLISLFNYYHWNYSKWKISQ